MHSSCKASNQSIISSVCTTVSLCPDNKLWSQQPVKETPNSASSSQLNVHFLDKNLKSVKLACNVPKNVACFILANKDCLVSSGLIITSVKLQN